MTCGRCLDGRHVRCELGGCGCNICARPADPARKQRRRTTTSRPAQRASRANPERQAWRKANGYGRRGPIPPSDELISEAYRLKQQGLTWRQIGAKLGRDHSGIRRHVINRYPSINQREEAA